MFKKIILGAVLAIAAVQAFGQSAIIRGQIIGQPGVYDTLVTNGAGALYVAAAPNAQDACNSSGTFKSSAIINISTATTTQLVALSGSTVVYVCSFAMTISQVVTTANTIKFVYGTGSNCGTGTTDLTGAFGTGGITAAPPITVSMTSSGSILRTAVGNALCATTTIGGSASFSGVVTYVQQ